MPDTKDRLTPTQVRHRTIDIRISGDAEQIAAYAAELVNTSELIGKEVVKWTGPFDSKTQPGIKNMFLEIVPRR